jgi:hypothetical protein
MQATKVRPRPTSLGSTCRAFTSNHQAAAAQYLVGCTCTTAMTGLRGRGRPVEPLATPRPGTPTLLQPVAQPKTRTAFTQGVVKVAAAGERAPARDEEVDPRQWFVTCKCL